ncbi:AGR126Cp [Eremothecium gossypii ATCC 10895]|uniref:GPI ethanolamine phosphate transferase 3 n=1 Tax=Eremothecium gossypii (strain ATCC 10895 / CBS 109.51 / FGSC 9923 / NRRL Y-1056) TaxID=284811 RepID=GPI13_EREGS|nr:AGR126Cp [Eremothecium gossypii ATCC 10895]Q74ZS2.2 RecName: Full=GPI ethanolamine phosphate transferase 3; AltName: Full=Glycosylphosphatidylinositol-anchor biosynthesis protein 13 [Eremothecium gossypii ATCC 10895]AAS54616.2 AGR126Cp [Eremothecium gossypii ATCC 10895]AEY98946.1 FAGR126Cp [Eremothecium gossypii FDAG1]
MQEQIEGAVDEELLKQSVLNNDEDDRRLTKLRIERFRTTHTLYIFLYSALAALQFIAIAFFTRGFLLSRKVLDDVANRDESTAPAKFDRLVLLVVDALRFDFVIPVDVAAEGYNSHYHNHLRALYERWDESILLKFLADPPTTTLQRLKGLTTGSLPTFIDAGSNFNGDVIDEDNIIKQMCLNNKTIYFAGDDTWDALFHPYLSNVSMPYESLNVWDLDTVDNGVISFFEDHLLNNPTEKKEWDVLVGHMLGIDHVGHKYGPSHFSMAEKQSQVDGFIRQIIDAVDEDTLLVVMGDHGMDHTGNHGGDSPAELESTLWLYTKRPGTWRRQAPAAYNTTELGRYYRAVNQIDLVPSLSLLLGLPIPFNNLGWPIEELAHDDDEWRLFTRQTLMQLETYRNTSNSITDSSKLKILEELKINANSNSSDAGNYQAILLEMYKDLWARFDYYSIGTGIILLIISLAMLITITRLIPSIVVGQMLSELVPTIIVMPLVSNVCFLGVFYVLRQPAFLQNWLWASLLATAVGIIIGFYVPIFDRYNLTWLVLRFGEELSDYWSRVAAFLITLHALIFTSNSFTIWEDKIVSFSLTTLGMLTLYEFVFLPKRHSTSAILAAALGEKEGTVSGISSGQANSDSLPLGRFARIVGGYHSIVLIVCTRLASLITICREEQGAYCTPTFTLTNNYSFSVMLGCLFLVFATPACIKGYYNVSSSYQAAAPIWIGMLMKSILFVNFIYWELKTFENTSDTHGLNLTIFNLTISRIVVGVSLVAANIGWMMGPLCIKLNVHNNDRRSQQATILGYANAYGAQYFLLVINFFMCILLFNKPLAQLSLFLMCNQLLSILEIFDLLKLKENLIGPVALGLLSYQQFFSTGHQATIPAVQWDMGFILTERITFPFTHLGIVLNTFGPHILCGISVALLTLWKQPPGILRANTLLARVVSNCGMLLIYQTVLCLSTFIWVTNFRRHLMVWKIFCPRFMFAALSLIVTQLVLTFITIAFASGRLIKQIDRMFWK